MPPCALEKEKKTKKICQKGLFLKKKYGCFSLGPKRITTDRYNLAIRLRTSFSFRDLIGLKIPGVCRELKIQRDTTLVKNKKTKTKTTSHRAK